MAIEENEALDQTNLHGKSIRLGVAADLVKEAYKLASLAGSLSKEHGALFRQLNEVLTAQSESAERQVLDTWIEYRLRQK
jgi:uncharacterized protein YbaA (DUF1428 family)